MPEHSQIFILVSASASPSLHNMGNPFMTSTSSSAVRPASHSEIRSLLRRLKAQAHDQLVAEVAKLAAEVDRLTAENAELRDDLYHAEHSAERWREDALQFQDELAEQTGGTRGLTISGQLVVIPAGAVQ